MRGVDQDIISMFMPDEKRKEYITIANNLSKDAKPIKKKPTRWELKSKRNEAFCKALRRLTKIDEAQRFELLHKFFNEIRGGGRGYHEKFTKAVDRINWRIDLSIEDDLEYESMMWAEIRRVQEKD